MTASTPGTASAAVSITALTVPPNAGGCAIAVCTIPGRWMSIVNIAVPLVLATLSTLGVSLPISVNWPGDLSTGFSGGLSEAASAASSPKLALRAPLETTPFDTFTDAAGTPQRFAAASTSIARAEAPALRICIQLLEIADEPPVPIVPKARFL